LRASVRGHFRGRGGFTLIELTVSLGVAAIMFLMIDRIFYETQRAVTAGIKTGEIMVKAETIGDQLQRDAEIMLGPGASGANRGCLIITQKLYTNVPILDANFAPGPGYVAPVSGPAGRREDIRSDQIAFFVDGGSSTKIPSLTPKDQSTLSAERHFQYGRVWYGHAMVTKPDGNLGNGAFGSVDNAENLYANRWVLGRQNLLFRDTTYTYAGSEVYGSYTISGSDIKPSTTVNVSQYATPLYQSQSDVCFHDLSTVWDNIVSYPTEPLGFTYLDDDNRKRLWVNRALTGGQQAGARTFTSSGMSQLHPLLAANISDFIVEFAGDYDGDNAIDTDGNNIKWYGFWFNNSVELRRDPAAPYGVSLAYDSTQPTVFKPPTSAGQFVTGTATVAAPNEAYYVGSASAAAANADAVFIFRHDDIAAGTNKWPYLLRVRYRLHDDNGVIASSSDAGRTMGKWYEHIIRVPRP
jgi:hypothetical protein